MVNLYFFLEKYNDKERYGTKLIILGPPGSGKGTYASRLQSKLDIPAISTGDILRKIRESNSDIAKEVRRYMDSGGLVPDEILLSVLKERFSEDDAKKGFILDGYPRTIEQAKALDSFTKLDAVINLTVPTWIIVERLSNRRICRSCGEVYNLRYLKPKVEGVCDKCGGELYQRMDDTPEVIKERLRIYEKKTQPLLEYYKLKVSFAEFKCEDINIPPDVAVEDILNKLRKLKIN